jgi:hypothetical protein
MARPRAERIMMNGYPTTKALKAELPRILPLEMFKDDTSCSATRPTTPVARCSMGGRSRPLLRQLPHRHRKKSTIDIKAGAGGSDHRQQVARRQLFLEVRRPPVAIAIGYPARTPTTWRGAAKPAAASGPTRALNACSQRRSARPEARREGKYAAF